MRDSEEKLSSGIMCDVGHLMSRQAVNYEILGSIICNCLRTICFLITTQQALLMTIEFIGKYYAYPPLLLAKLVLAYVTYIAIAIYMALIIRPSIYDNIM